MSFDRTLWRPFFSAGVSPAWPCPRCPHGTLEPVAKSFKREETVDSFRARDHEDWEPEWERHRFAGLLKCTRSECGEPVAVCGYTVVEAEYDEEYNRSLTELLRPVFFHPAIPMLRLPAGMPEAVKSDLERAFAAFWSDGSATANSIRSALESLLTHLGVKTQAVGKNKKMRRLSLHERIKLYETKNAAIAESMLAVKWLGNVGSHPGGLSEEDLLDGLELVDHVLYEVIGKRSERVKKLGKAIVKAKGKRKK